MKLKWEKYWYDFFSSVLKHVGTAWGAWTGTNAISAAGILNVPALNLTHLAIFTVTAGVIPAISSFWSRTPLPEIVEETIISRTTTKSQPDQSPNETTPPHPSPPHDPPLSG